MECVDGLVHVQISLECGSQVDFVVLFRLIFTIPPPPLGVRCGLVVESGLPTIGCGGHISFNAKMDLAKYLECNLKTRDSLI